ncbi:MAG: hypothetical protein COV36_06235 [Alphaproteobacteria bacterium CG11_big_fil_rev_8_21_14_0_20_44_7]|nr:MAG: hypothetical protein COV36_06235 [Alphaproteobacteria bacterium CG11_big_fil_rev_8_21_14_0_20_44_7]
MLNRLVFAETKELARILGNDNIRFVGGCVRDLIAEQPISDIDFATVFTPEQVIYHCGKHDIRVIPTGIQHGTVTVIIGSYQFQVTTLRRDVSTDGRRAVVEYVDDWEADASRRDFTINAFYLSIDGKLTDFFGGMDHLRSNKIVFIGNAEERIKEDYLRILRYFRFSGKFGGGNAPDDGLARLFSRYSAHINYLSGERLHSEMFKILCLDNAPQTLAHMQNCGVLHFIFPGDVSFDILRNLIAIEDKPNPIRRLAAIEGYDVKALCEHWKLSGEHTKTLKAIKSDDIAMEDPKIIMRHLGKDRFRDIAYLEAARGRLPYELHEVLEFATQWKIPNFPIYGHDVMALGLKEGRKIGQILSKLEVYWEQHGFLLSREELLKRLRILVEEAQVDE